MSWATSLRRRKEKIDGVLPADANPYILRPNIRRGFRVLISVSSAPRVLHCGYQAETQRVTRLSFHPSWNSRSLPAADVRDDPTERLRSLRHRLQRLHARGRSLTNRSFQNRRPGRALDVVHVHQRRRWEDSDAFDQDRFPPILIRPVKFRSWYRNTGMAEQRDSASENSSRPPPSTTPHAGETEEAERRAGGRLNGCDGVRRRLSGWPPPFVALTPNRASPTSIKSSNVRVQVQGRELPSKFPFSFFSPTATAV